MKYLGYTVIFIGFDKTVTKTDLAFNYSKRTFETFTYYSIKYPSNIKERVKYILGIKYAVKLIEKESISHIVAYNYPAIALFRLLYYCRQKDIKLVGDCTEWHGSKGNILYRVFKDFDVLLRMRIIQPKLDGLIVISEYLKKYYKNKVKHLIHLPPLVDLSMDKWKIKPQIIKSNSLTLVYAGSTTSKMKDRLDIIINVLSEIRRDNVVNFLFNVIGMTKQEYKNIFNINSLPIQIDEFVSFKGRLKHIEALKEVMISDYQIFIRDLNLVNMAGFPTKYVESISCGIPVLTNSSSNIESFFESGKTGFILDTSSSDRLKESLLKALTVEEEKIKCMKNYCRNSEKFNYLHYIQQFENFMNNLSE